MYFYNDTQGYWECLTAPSQEYVDNLPAGTIEVPQKPNAWSDLDVATLTWSENTSDKHDHYAAQVREERATRLHEEVDPIASNNLRWAELSAAEQTEVSTYRTALLNITDQAGFPHSVTWPTKPSFL